MLSELNFESFTIQQGRIMEKHTTPELSREDFILNVLSLSPNESFSPVQIQKLFFLLEKRLNLNYFSFIPYHYGPYDKELTNTLRCLSLFGDRIEVVTVNGITHYQINNRHKLDADHFL